MDGQIDVLIVDDDPEVADLASTMLERADSQLAVEAVTAADAAIEQLENGAVDCIVSDYQMPSTSGLELLEQVRDRDPRLPFILFTGRGSEEVASEAIAAGVTQYLQKRGGSDQYTLLANQITNAVEQYRTETELRDRERRYRRTLASLHETTRELMRAGTKTEIYRALVGSVRDVLEAAAVGAYSFDPTARALELVSADSAPGATWTRPEHLGESDDAVWTAFSTGEADLSDETVVLPLGAHGVLVVESDGHEDASMELLQILAANAEAALDRAEREELLRDHDRRLTEQNEELTRLNQLNEVVREINRSVTGAGTREEVEETVCERLAATDRYLGAWIADETSDPLEPRAWAGLDATYLDTVRAEGESAPEVTLAQEALGSGTPVVEGTVLEGETWSSRRQEAITHGFQTVLAVPIVGGDRRYGALLVYLEAPDAVDEAERTVLAELSETVGHAIRSAERTRSMVTDSRLEVELLCPDPRFLLNEVAAVVDGPVALEGIVDRGAGRPVLFLSLEGAVTPEIEELPERREAIARVSILSSEEGGSIVEVTATSVPLLGILGEYDARISAARAESGEATLVLSLPAAVDPRSMIEAIERAHPETELVARRESETRPPVRGLDAHLESALTERQREALEAAHYAGYFEWPRETTGEDLAETLDVASPTYHYHLRAAQRKLVAVAFGDEYN